jgi:hypothetical protein
VSSRQKVGDTRRREGPCEPTPARTEPDEAAEVLRSIWSASSQTAAELDELFGTAKSCKSMRDVGFDGLAATGGDLRGAWRATLEREGKLTERPGSVADLVLGSAERARQ